MPSNCNLPPLDKLRAPWGLVYKSQKISALHQVIITHLPLLPAPRTHLYANLKWLMPPNDIMALMFAGKEKSGKKMVLPFQSCLLSTTSYKKQLFKWCTLIISAASLQVHLDHHDQTAGQGQPALYGSRKESITCKTENISLASLLCKLTQKDNVFA